MANPLDERLLALTAIVTVGYQFLFFSVTYALKFDKLTDFAGSTNFIALALITLIVGGEYEVRQIVLTVCVVVWGARLGGFLLFRILQWGEDRRFDDQRQNIGRLAVFWLLQAVWVWTVSLPVTIVNSKESVDGVPATHGLTALDYVGWALFALGLIIEAVADQQKYNFKQASDSKWVNKGEWSWSRHPNYFGEIVVWWGLYISSINDLEGAEHAAVVGPIFITLLLLFVSGIPIQEKSYDKKYGKYDGYWDYKRQTSLLIPIPPSMYRPLPEIIKKTLLLDFKIYNPGPPDDDEDSDDNQQKGKANESTELVDKHNRNRGENAV